jgi:hypothetical protein
VRSVGLFRRDAEALAFTDGHAFNGFLEAGDYLPGAQSELQRLAALGAVELRTVIQGTAVMDLYRIVIFCL